jgi:hypothetical protein
MQVTSKLYKQLFKVAKHKCFGNEDYAAECVNQVLLNLEKYTGDVDCESQFWGWARTLITNKRNDLFRKEKLDVVYYGGIFDDYLADEVYDDSMFEFIKKHLTEEEYNFCIKYFDKLIFFRIKNKLEKKKNPVKYTIQATHKDGTVRLFVSMAEAAKYFGFSEQHIRKNINNNRFVKSVQTIFTRI